MAYARTLKSVMSTLYLLMNKKTGAVSDYNVDQLAEKAGVSKNSWIRAIKELEKNQWVKVLRGTGAGNFNIYTPHRFNNGGYNERS